MIFLELVDFALELVLLHNPVSPLLLDCKDQSRSLLLRFLCFLLAIIETKLERLSLTVDLLLVLSNSAVALVLDLLELKCKLLFVLLLLRESLFQ